MDEAIAARIAVATNANRRRSRADQADGTLGAYKPSTLIDFEAGRPLEIEAIWGEPLRRATAAGAAMPELERLYGELKASTRRCARDQQSRCVVSDSPSIILRNAQRRLRVDAKELRRFCERRATPLPARTLRAGGELDSLDEISIVLVSDRRWRVAQAVHEIDGPTDVLTFSMVNFVSVETAQENAAQFGTTAEGEIRLYIVHGLLHLRGFDDIVAGRCAAHGFGAAAHPRSRCRGLTSHARTCRFELKPRYGNFAAMRWQQMSSSTACWKCLTWSPRQPTALRSSRRRAPNGGRCAMASGRA
jgi:ssRNA-specific RNase YbeY (16S rRNA maturation enzyme)